MTRAYRQSLIEERPSLAVLRLHDAAEGPACDSVVLLFVLLLVLPSMLFWRVRDVLADPRLLLEVLALLWLFLRVWDEGNRVVGTAHELAAVIEAERVAEGVVAGIGSDNYGLSRVLRWRTCSRRGILVSRCLEASCVC